MLNAKEKSIKSFSQVDYEKQKLFIIQNLELAIDAYLQLYEQNEPVSKAIQLLDCELLPLKAHIMEQIKHYEIQDKLIKERK